MKTALIVLGVILVVVLLLVLGGAGAGMMGYGTGYGMMGRYGMPSFGLAFPFFCLLGPLFWVLVIACIVWLVITLMQRSGGAPALGMPPRETPLDILKARYAKGEITKEQFEGMKKDLG